MKNLVIVESPTKARTLSRFLGPDFQIEATMGHIRDLPEKKLGIDVAHEFTPDYQLIVKRKDRIRELTSYAKNAERIILASDPDREGEAIAWHTKEVLGSRFKVIGKEKKEESKNLEPNTYNLEPKFERISFHEITKSAIDEALKNPREIDMQLVDAQQARRVLDRLVGYKLSPLLWKKMGMRWLSAGRVQSVAVRLIVEREREILAFKPLEYWIIDVELEKSSQGSGDRNQETKTFLARLSEINGKKAEIGSKEITDAVVENLKNAVYTVSDVATKEVRRFSLPPFTTSTLQQAASNKFGWSAKRTMHAAQSLYEEGYITYHRTDSTNLSTEAIGMVREFISVEFNKLYLPSEPKLYKTKSKVAQEAHEAIRPTKVRTATAMDMSVILRSKTTKNPVGNEDSARDPSQSLRMTLMPEGLGRDLELLYSLIWRRFVASQMSEAVFDQTSLSIEAKYDAEVYRLKVGGQKMKFDGFLALYEKERKGEEEKKGEEEENREVPALTIGEGLNYIKTIQQQKFTEPPARYSEASLIKILEEKSIGRPSTYAPIISTIQDRKYVEKMEKRFRPTDLGNAVADFLVKNFPTIFDVAFTAQMEGELDGIANGEYSWVNVIRDFYTPFAVKLNEVSETGEKVSVSFGVTDEICPNCGKPLAVKIGRAHV